MGWILVVIGIVAFLADLLLWSSRGPGYLRRTTVVDDPGYGGYPMRRGYGRRQVIEEEDAGPPQGDQHFRSSTHRRRRVDP